MAFACKCKYVIPCGICGVFVCRPMTVVLLVLFLDSMLVLLVQVISNSTRPVSKKNREKIAKAAG